MYKKALLYKRHVRHKRISRTAGLFIMLQVSYMQIISPV